ncbi:MAG: hypothetical protein SFW36_02615, partial [Leptolyngbyaceae cyanobacterium bins.59]|nr:hypothetical protein [Leptolyngbyaceae cyanobacterium bins.59]
PAQVSQLLPSLTQGGMIVLTGQSEADFEPAWLRVQTAFPQMSYIHLKGFHTGMILLASLLDYQEPVDLDLHPFLPPPPQSPYLPTLRQINLVAFVNWTESEEDLYAELGRIIRGVFNHPQANEIVLLLTAYGVSQENAELILADVTMGVMGELTDIPEVLPEIALVPPIASPEWLVIVPHLTARLKLQQEHQEAIVMTQAGVLPVWHVDESGEMACIWKGSRG